MREPIRTETAPPPKGPYSQAIVCRGAQLYIAGQGPLDPATGEISGSTFEEQATRTARDIFGVLREGGGHGAATTRADRAQ